MGGNRTRRIVPVVAVTAALVAAACVHTAARAAGTISIGQVETGNVFAEPDTPKVDVHAAGKVKWCAYDFWNTEVDTADGVEVPGGSLRLRLPVETTGFYRLHVVPEGGDCAAAPTTGRTRFALLPAPRSSATDGMTYSVQTHFAQEGWHPEMVPLIGLIGAEGVRDAQPWQYIETSKGGYQFDTLNKRFTNYMRALKAEGLEPHIGLGLANKFYDNKCTPFTDDGRKAFAAFAKQVKQHYGDQIKTMGIYNEPNGHSGDFCLDGGGPGEANSEEVPHYAIAKEVFQELPDEVTVTAPELAGGLTGWADKREWLSNYFDLGGLTKLDVVALHTYRPNGRQEPGKDCAQGDERCHPEGLLEDQIKPVRELLAEHGAPDKELWITEMGWKSGLIGDENQAAYLPRAHVVAMAGGVTRFNWYNFRDHKADTFGLIHKKDDPEGAYTPKPAYVAYAVLTSQLTGLTYRTDDQVGGDVHSHVFGGGAEPVRVMWSATGDQTVRIEAKGEVTVTDLMGRTTTLDTDTLTLSGDPSYVHGDITKITS